MSHTYKMYINGELVEGKGDPIDVYNPATGELIATVKGATAEQAEDALQGAKKAFETWQYMSITERTGWMYKMRDACVEKKDLLLDLLSQECGRAWNDVVGDYARFIDYFGYYAEECKRMYDTGLIDYPDTRKSFYRVMRRPIGVVVGHLAWNVPLFNIGAKLSPVMASGCTCVLKPSASTPLASLMVGEIAHEIGLPAGVMNMITGKSSVIGKYMNESTIPAMVTCIGSTETGLQIMSQIPTSVKKLSLELGGSAPCIIMPDCDMDSTVDFVAKRKVGQTGQSCGCINRIYVHESIHDEFIEKLTNVVKSIKLGWGKDMADCICGSLIDEGARKRLLGVIDDAVKNGAKLIYGGAIPDDLPDQFKNGCFMMPTIVDNVRDEMSIAKDELFGPVMGVQTFSDYDDALRRANDTKYGLTAYLFSHDMRYIGRFIEEVDAGRVIVNAAAVGGANMPHTGHKQSGFGSIFGPWSMEEYYSVKLAAIKP